MPKYTKKLAKSEAAFTGIIAGTSAHSASSVTRRSPSPAVQSDCKSSKNKSFILRLLRDFVFMRKRTQNLRALLS